MERAFDGEIHYWRGPAPYHFVALPVDDALAVDAVAEAVTYGWGMVPVSVRIGDTTWRTSLFPKDGGYLLPLRDSVRRKESLALGDVVSVRLTVAGVG